MLYKSALKLDVDKRGIKTRSNSSRIYELTDEELQRVEERFTRRRKRLRLECSTQGHRVPDFIDINERITWELNQIFHDPSLNMSGQWQTIISRPYLSYPYKIVPSGL